eukprot:gene9671-20113_t
MFAFTGVVLWTLFYVDGFHTKIARFTSNTKFVGVKSLTRATKLEYVPPVDTIKFSRLNENSTSDELLLYLPGIDGIGSYSLNTLSNLSADFDVWQMGASPDDRTSFMDLTNIVMDFINSQNKSTILMGESLGCILTLYITTRSPSLISKIILINPATSFDKTIWTDIDTILPFTRPFYPVLFPAFVMGTVASPGTLISITQSVMNKINSTKDMIRETKTLIDYAKFLTNPDVVRWRITKWIKIGNSLLGNKLSTISKPILILVGNNDRLLPSLQESESLEDTLINSQVEVLSFKNGGHALLADIPNISNIILHSKTFQPYPPKTKPSGSSSIEFPFPTRDEIARGDETIRGLRKALSPIFLQRRKDGTLIEGLEGLPVGSEGRPVLYVGNHQLIGFDIPLLGREFLIERNTLIRGLAHPVVFLNQNQNKDIENNYNHNDNDNERNGDKENGDQISSTKGSNSKTDFANGNFFRDFGAVEVSPTALFQSNATALLYPGGVAEALHGKGEAYKLFWPERVDFVRMAAVFGAIIVPFAGVGSADSLEMILDGEEILRTPYLGDNARRARRKIPQAKAATEERFVFPLVLPKLPSRVYYIFEEPFDTRTLNIYDKKQCRVVYDDIRSRVQHGIDFLLSFRESDPYKDYIPRTLYETVTGVQAPTAPFNALTNSSLIK